MQDLNKMTVSELREVARTLGLSGYEKMKKGEVFNLVMATLNPDGNKEEPEKKTTPAKKAESKKKTQSEKKDEPKKKTVSKKKTKAVKEAKETAEPAPEPENEEKTFPISGIFEQTDSYGFVRSANFLSGEDDVYVHPQQIKKFGLRTGDILTGTTREKHAGDKYPPLLELKEINGITPEESIKRGVFEKLTPVFPDERIHLETSDGNKSMRIVDLVSPIGKGQRGMIVSPPKAGKTTLLKNIASAVKANHPEMKLIILLIDERPEEVTDIKESIEGPNVEVIYSTFDELPEHHKKVTEMVLAHAKRLVEQKFDVMILLDSITRLSRAYNLVCTPSGRTLSGGLDPAALYSPKKFFGAARNMREGGSLTVLATALIETGSRMDEVIFEEFKGTGNMELVLDRKMSERRIFPAIDMLKSSTRRDDLLLSQEEYDTMNYIRKGIASLKPEDATERLLDLFTHTKTNNEFINVASKRRWSGPLM